VGPGLGLGFTVEEEVALGRRTWAGAGTDRRVGRFRHANDGVTHLARRDPTTLSGGELQRVMFAGVAAMEPQVFLLDEAGMELDPPAPRKL